MSNQFSLKSLFDVSEERTVRVERKLITPSVAAAMLENNTENRPLSKPHMKKLAREMTLGRWMFNGDTISMDGDLLVDGQHRLAACIESGVPFDTLIIWGINRNVFPTKDVGKFRSKGDTLATKKEKYAGVLASSLTFVDEYMSGLSITLHMKSKKYTNTEVEMLINKYPGIRDSAEFASKHRTKQVTPKMIGGMHYLFSRKDPDLTILFFESLLKGTGLREDEPVYLLRERLAFNAFSKAKLPPIEIFALFIKAWNATRAGKKLKILRWSKNHNEDFPTII